MQSSVKQPIMNKKYSLGKSLFSQYILLTDNYKYTSFSKTNKIIFFSYLLDTNYYNNRP